MVVKHKVELISIGNGTASRETDKLVIELIKLVSSRQPGHVEIAKIVVSEAGASVYSASALAAAFWVLTSDIPMTLSMLVYT